MNIKHVEQVNYAVRQFAETLSKEPLVTLRHTPIDADYLSDYCYLNVQDYLSRNEGTIQHGWLLYQVGARHFWASFHTNIKLADGSLLEITPSKYGTEQFVFLPDNQRICDYKNFRVPVSVALDRKRNELSLESHAKGYERHFGTLTPANHPWFTLNCLEIVDEFIHSRDSFVIVDCGTEKKIARA